MGEDPQAKLEIGEDTLIGPYVCMAGPGSIKIGKDCMIASHASLYANNHIFTDRETPVRLQGLTCRSIEIGDDCWLGTGVRVVDGVKLGKGCIIGAGAVVTRSLPPYSIAVGVPAKVIGQRGKATEVTLQ
jgi:acetyltransferase-like isoleucine patch superfamily enzyme